MSPELELHVFACMSDRTNFSSLIWITCTDGTILECSLKCRPHWLRSRRRQNVDFLSLTTSTPAWTGRAILQKLYANYANYAGARTRQCLHSLHMRKLVGWYRATCWCASPNDVPVMTNIDHLYGITCSFRLQQFISFTVTVGTAKHVVPLEKLARMPMYNQLRFYVGARGHRPPKILPSPPNFGSNGHF